MISRRNFFISIFLFIFSLFLMLLIFSESGIMVRNQKIKEKEIEEELLRKNIENNDELRKKSVITERDEDVVLLYTFSQDVRVEEGVASNKTPTFIPLKSSECLLYSLIIPSLYLVVSLIVNIVKRRKDNGKDN